MKPTELRAARKRLGMTQSQLGAALKVSLSLVQKMEKGNTPIIHRTVMALEGLERLHARCAYCDDTGEVEMDNNGPIGPCPVCQ